MFKEKTYIIEGLDAGFAIVLATHVKNDGNLLLDPKILRRQKILKIMK
jgi:hypothetical protein